MINESAALRQAREHLQTADAALSAPDADYHIEEGFYLLEDMIVRESSDATVAANLGKAYFDKLLTSICHALEPRDVPEPMLKHLMKLSQILAAASFAEDADVPSITASIARRYIDSVFEGYTPADKKRAIQRLMDKSGLADPV